MKLIYKSMIIAVIFLTALLFNADIFAANDNISPSIGIGMPSAWSVVEGGTVTYTVNATDDTAVTRFHLNSDYIALNGFTANISVNGNTVTLSNIRNASTSNSKYITIRNGAAQDAAGNKSEEASSAAFAITSVADKEAPIVGISAPSVTSVVEGGTVTFTINAKDNVKVTKFYLNSDYIILNGFTANISVSGEKVTLSNIRSNSASNSKYITIKAGIAQDAAGNKSEEASSAPFTIKVKPVENKDTIPPVIGISAPSANSVVEGGIITFTVNAKDNVKVTKFDLVKDNIVLNGFTATVTIADGKVTLSNIKNTTTSKSKYITVKAGIAQDAAGNKSEEASSAPFTITAAKDTIPPVIGISAPSANSVVEGGIITFTVNAKDNVKVTKFDLVKDNIVLNGFTATVTIADGKVTLSNIKNTTTSKSKYITVKAGIAQDAAGNKSEEASSAPFTITAKPVENKDTVAPIVTISKASPSGVYAGGTVEFIVTFSDNVAVTSVNLTSKNVILNGFSANITITGSGLRTRTIKLTNIKGNVGNANSITIAKGVIADAAGNVNASATSPKFSIMRKITPIVVPSEQITTTITGNCIDDLDLLGDINKEITYFSSWLRAEKYTASYVQENNYVAEDERMTYMVEYYNGSTAPAPNVVFTLTIPYNVDIEEINGNGYIKSRTEDETVIEWNMGKIPSGAYCRLYVRVRFNENEDLEKSSKISEVFYATLKTTAGGNTSYSYMRQLFIDKTEGKKGTYRSYLASIDNTNSIRPEDEITRAEFAKLLADSGIIKVDEESTAYKAYKDWENIPVYARAAVAALTNTDIIQAFPDGTFKPNNPILMEDAIQMIAQAATYISDSKLTVMKPTFLYTNALKDSEGEISAKKDYIMELMRQNVIVKYESNPDDYALRKDIVNIVNALTFRGPYVEKLPANALKFIDIRDDSVYFYNIIGAANTYTYTYDYRLWQEIIEVNN